MPERQGVPQLEDGFARIANEILEAIARTPLSDYESRCVHFLWRKTYGWQNPNGESKKVDVISEPQWAEGTGIPRRHITRVLNRLVARKVFTKEVIYHGKSRRILWGFQKRYKEWVAPKQVPNRIQPAPIQVPTEVAPKEVLVKAEAAPKQVPNRVQLAPIQDRVAPKQVPQLAPIQGHTKDNKDTIQKIYTVVFNFWNSQKIISHKKLSEDIKRAIKTALDTYSERELCQAIGNYAEILKDEGYYFKYRWTLKDFLKRGLEKFLDLDIAKANYRKDKLPIRGELLKEQLGPRGKPFEQYAKEQEEVS